MRKQVIFTRITTLENIQKGAYWETEEKGPKFLKGELCIVFTDVFGVPYVQNITQMIRKYTCGQMISRGMVENISRALKQMEFYVEETEHDTCILELERSIKKASRENGYS